MKLRIENMTCDGCARSVTRAIQRLDPVAMVKVNREAGTAEVMASAPSDVVLRTLGEAGYPAELMAG